MATDKKVQTAGAPSADEKDKKIRNEPDTKRIRSERQSVIDNSKKNTKGGRKN